MTDDRDNAGVVAPPPLIYGGPLLLGLLLNRKFGVSFLPRGTARILGWPLLMGWFFRTMRRADKPIDSREPVARIVTDGSVPLHSQPRLSGDDNDLHGAA